ncbi:hypothetical protein [Nocardia flavorosea]|uniref:Uncharacterized protein n=1 Tax=Nocardia flavorosea TaxID=53429 RepID=A0A846YSG5_9NOCA|nr:hypothetical protein [Nocardia flavorosea]NKY60424.1 hypothetical protein [Nocardia flavorosea]
MTDIRPLDWTDNLHGDHSLSVGLYQATVYEMGEHTDWVVFYCTEPISSGHAFTPERAKADAEDAITNHQMGAAA